MPTTRRTEPDAPPAAGAPDAPDVVRARRSPTVYDRSMGRITPRRLTVEINERTLGRLSVRSQARGETEARTAERLIDEGLRMEDHPGIAFRDGPSGRRAGLVGGPDVSEIVAIVHGTGETGDAAIEAAAQWSNLSPAQVRNALSYYHEYRD